MGQENRSIKPDLLTVFMRSILTGGLCEDVEREGLKNTPERWANMMQGFLTPQPFTFTTFASETDEMVIVDPIPFYSLCEHHILPFFGTAAIAYVPDKRMCGLSKLPRTLEMFARQLQNQERITTQVADFLMENLQPLGVGVRLRARHMCMEMRGVRTHDAYTTTTAIRGCFEEAAARSEFLQSIKQ